MILDYAKLNQNLIGPIGKMNSGTNFDGVGDTLIHGTVFFGDYLNPSIDMNRTHSGWATIDTIPDLGGTHTIWSCIDPRKRVGNFEQRGLKFGLLRTNVPDNQPLLFWTCRDGLSSIRESRCSEVSQNIKPSRNANI